MSMGVSGTMRGGQIRFREKLSRRPRRSWCIRAASLLASSHRSARGITLVSAVMRACVYAWIVPLTLLLGCSDRTRLESYACSCDGQHRYLKASRVYAVKLALYSEPDQPNLSSGCL